MQLLRADAQLRAEAELTAVGEAGARVHVDAGAVDACMEGAGMGAVVRADGLAMARRMAVYVADCFVYAAYDLDHAD